MHYKKGFFSLIILIILLTTGILSILAAVPANDTPEPVVFPAETMDHVDGGLIYLADHPDRMEELGATPAPDGYINVLIQLEVMDESTLTFVEELGGTVTDSWFGLNSLGATVPMANLPSLTFIPGLEWLEPSLRVYPLLASSVPAIGGDRVWADYGLRGENTTIAILDTGINGNHEYLDDLDEDPETDDPKIIGFYDARSGSRGERDPVDTGNHGSHCAGIAAGTGGTSRTDVGMAPQANLVGVIVIDGGGGNANDIIDGINWVIDNKDRFSIDVMSISLGGAITIPGATNDGNSVVSQAVDRAVEAGIVAAVAVGNGNAGVAAHAGSVTFPADSRRAITVGWVNDNGNRVVSSSRGPTGDGRIKPDVMAPGSNVDSAKGQAGDTGSRAGSGSSMSTPHVAGLAALMLQANPNLAPDENVDYIKQIMHETSRHEWGNSPDPAEPYSPNNQYGWGTVDSVGAVQRALDLRSGRIGGDITIQLSDSSHYEITSEYTKTQYTYQGENGDSHNPPLGSTAPDVVYMEAHLSSDWPEPTDITADAKAFSGIIATIEPDPMVAEEIDGDWVIKAWFNYTGDGDSGEYWSSYPTLGFNLTAPGEADQTSLGAIFQLNSIPGISSRLDIFATGESPDLTIISLETDNPEPVEGEIVKITATVENLGNGNAIDARLQLFDGNPDEDGVELTSIQITDLGARSSRSYGYDWNTTGQTGDHTLYARVDDVSPKDTDPGNNDADPIGLEVKEAPDPGSNHPPEITILSPDENGDDADESYRVEWVASDMDGDSIILDLYYDSDTIPDNGKMIIGSGVGNTGNLQWDCSDIDEGDYYIYGIADDNNGSTSGDYSEGVLHITHEGQQENHEPTIEVLEPGESGGSTDRSSRIEWQAFDDDDDTLTITLAYDTDTNSNNGNTRIVSDLENTGSFDWNTDSVDEGEYYILATADDGRGGVAEAYSQGSVTITHGNAQENTAPGIGINFPSNRTTVKDTISISGPASDEDGDDTLQTVEVSMDEGGWLTATEAGGEGTGWSEWEFSLYTNDLEEGWHTLNARAFDGESYSVIVWVEVFVDNIEPKGNVPPQIVSFLGDRTEYRENEIAVFNAELLDENGGEDIEAISLLIKLVENGQESTVRSYGEEELVIQYSGYDRIRFSMQMDLKGLKAGSYSAVLEVIDTEGESTSGNVWFGIEGKSSGDEEGIFESGTTIFMVIGSTLALVFLGVFLANKKKESDDIWGSGKTVGRGRGQFVEDDEGPSAGSEAESNACPKCGGETEYSQDEDDHFCWNCKEYVEAID